MPTDIDDSSKSVPFPDNCQWEAEQLDLVLEDFLGDLVADESLCSDLARRAAKWQLLTPNWTYCDGAYELMTPYGLMRLGYFFGWHITRDTVPLVWWHNQKPVFFARLEDAKTSALLHARDRNGDSHDGTTWKRSL
jgi:hypothetical protein